MSKKPSYPFKYETQKIEYSPVLQTILHFIYRKKKQKRTYDEKVVQDLIRLGYLKKVTSKDGVVYYFKTESSRDFTAMDFAREYLWEFWNKDKRKIDAEGNRYVYCYSDKVPSGKGLVPIDEAVKRFIV